MAKTTFEDLKNKITHLEGELELQIAMGNKDTVTKFQLYGWCATALVVGGILSALLF